MITKHDIKKEKKTLILVKWYNSTTRIGILRIPRDYTDIYLASMFYMKQIETTPCSLHVLHVSGTVIFIQQKAIEWDRKFYIQEQQEAEKRGENLMKGYIKTEKLMHITGQIYSSNDKIEASKKSLAALS